MLSVGSGDGVDGESQQAHAEPKAPAEAQGKAAGMHVVQDNSAAFQAAVDAAVKAALAGNRNREKSTACNNWDYTGICSYGDRCRFSHDTTTPVEDESDKKEDAMLAGGKCNDCIEPGCGGCGAALKARRPGMHAIGWKRDLQTPDEN